MTSDQLSLEKTLQNLNIVALNEMQQNAMKAINKDASVVLLAPTGS